MKIYRTHVLIAQDQRSMLMGAQDIETALREEIKKRGLENEVAIIPTGSLGYDNGVAIAVYPESIVYVPVTRAEIPAIVEEHFLKGRIVRHLSKPISKGEVGVLRGTHTEKVLGVQQRIVLGNVGVINPENIDEYIAAEGYSAIAHALSSMTPATLLDEVKKSELRGRGGAGFPTGTKWAGAAQELADVKYIICNADEGEPGTFKDREIMEGDPHKLLEGMMLAGYATGAAKGYIYVRGEYTLAIARLNKAVKDAREKGLLGKSILGTPFCFDIEVVRGAGAYICGEESALIESIEGKRGEPRKKPPYPAQKGLWQKPTVVNNVETLANIPHIALNGGDWYRAIGVEGSRGTKIFSLMGDLNWKGVIEIPFGTPLSRIISEIGGGVRMGRKLKGVILGGVSGSLITPDELDTPVDFKALARIEAGPGSGAIIALDETRSIPDVVLNIAQFFHHESCGRCTPCRAGNEQIVHIIKKICAGKAEVSALDTLDELGRDMYLTSFCPLGQTAPNILAQSLKKYRGEWDECLAGKKDKSACCA